MENFLCLVYKKVVLIGLTTFDLHCLSFQFVSMLKDRYFWGDLQTFCFFSSSNQKSFVSLSLEHRLMVLKNRLPAGCSLGKMTSAEAAGATFEGNN